MLVLSFKAVILELLDTDKKSSQKFLGYWGTYIVRFDLFISRTVGKVSSIFLNIIMQYAIVFIMFKYAMTLFKQIAE